VFWNSLELVNIKDDLKQIKKDGFNTIILAIPWGEFQPSLNPVKFNNFAIERLKYLMKTTNELKINVILRISYFWDIYPGVSPPIKERFIRIFFDKNIEKVWNIYLRKIYKIVKQYPNFLFGFLSWEDFFHIFNVCKLNKKLRIKYAEPIGLIHYLKKRFSLSQIQKFYNCKFKSWRDVYIPDNTEPGFKLFLDYWNFLLVKKILVSAKKSFPDISMEIRIDKDPIYSRKKKILYWYNHDLQYKADLDFFTIYYSPAWGAENNWNYELSPIALKRFEAMLKEVKYYTKNKRIFIDQFNFYDNSPPSIGKTIIHPAFLSDFLDKSCNLLKKYTSGYSLWTYRDSDSSMIFNGFFEMGKKGWTVSGKTKLIKYNGDMKMVLFPKSHIKQFISNNRVNMGHFKSYDNLNLCFKSHSNSRSVLEAGDFNGIKKKFVLNKKEADYCIHLPYKEKYDIFFKSISGTSILDDVRFYGGIQQQLLYDMNNNPECLLNSIRKLNRCLK
jgi:hypothetical protein